MTMLDHANHSIQQKLYAPHYTHNNIAHFQAKMHEYLSELINVSIWPDFCSMLTVFQDFGIIGYGTRLPRSKHCMQ